MPKLTRSLSLVALIAANLVPLIGVIFFNWNANLILALFWIENLIIGAFTIYKILAVSAVERNAKGIVISAFFVFHYGAFCSAHGMLLWRFLDTQDWTLSVDQNPPNSGVLDIFARGVSVLDGFLALFGTSIILGISALLLSHLVSLIENFYIRGERLELSVNTLMSQPYKQIVVMHVGLIAGAFVLQKFESPMILLAIMVALKVVVDAKQHLARRHINNKQITGDVLQERQ